MISLKLCVLVVVFAALAFCSPKWDKSADDQKVFQQFCDEFHKTYKSEAEQKIAMENVLKAVDEIEKHNKLYDQGKKKYQKGLTEHSDLTDEQWENLMFGYIEEEEDERQYRSKRASDNHNEFPPGPDSIDWREKGLVGPVHDQLHCGSCWAFSTIEIVGSVWRKNNNTKVPSPQQLIDCSHHHTHGCHGGGPTSALAYVKENGLTDEDQYPYKHEEGKCQYKSDTKVGSINAIHLRIPNGKVGMFSNAQKNLIFN
jgi:C1A family cysteine protease